jgi:FKBP-type peptidyl-prolyl cis-trans isomerase
VVVTEGEEMEQTDLYLFIGKIYSFNMHKIKAQLFFIAAMLFSVSSSAQVEPVALSTPSDTLQYTLGAFVGQWMVDNNFTVTNPNLFYKAIEDKMLKRPLALPDSSINQLIAAYQLSNQKEKSKQMEAQLFAGLKGKAGVGALPNGVHYIVINAGSGVRPAANDTITMNVVGIFPDGTFFEDTFKKGQAIKNIPANLIPGLNEAIQLMPEGSVWRIFVPSALAYGMAGVPNLIPSNSALVFELTLEEVIQKK